MRRSTATARVESPLGGILLTANDTYLTGLRIPQTPDNMPTVGDLTHPILSAATAQLRDWLDGKSFTFDLPLAPCETAEGETLRTAIADIPYGTTMTYGDVATRCSSVARAIGGACKSNPFPIIIPCHRVTSAAGPEYYSGGGGPRTKTWLLDFEYSNLPADQRTRLL